MKKFILFLLVVAIGLGYFWYKQNPRKEEVRIMPTVSKPDIANATFVFEGEEIKFKNGESNTQTTETSLIGEVVYADINGDSKNDAVSLAIQSGGGSGLFVYLLAYVSGNVEYKSTEAVFIADRISPQSLKVNSDGDILLSYLDRGPSEPMSAEPTITTTKTFVFKNGSLEER